VIRYVLLIAALSACEKTTTPFDAHVAAFAVPK